MKSLETKTVKFTVNDAVEALKRNRINRPVSSFTVRHYTEVIKRGEWKLNGEAIIFDWDGNLVQGQHRCHAVIAAETPIETLVVRGADPKSFYTYDQGKNRSGSDVLAIHGNVNTRALAAAARAILRIEQTGAGFRKYTNTQIVSAVEEHATLPYWVREWVGSKAKKFMVSSFPGVLTLASERHGSELMLNFLSRVSEGTGLRNNDPAFVLRERFINRIRGRQIHSDIALGFCIKAINAEVQGKKIQILRMSPDETFPELV